MLLKALEEKSATKTMILKKELVSKRKLMKKQHRLELVKMLVPKRLIQELIPLMKEKRDLPQRVETMLILISTSKLM